MGSSLGGVVVSISSLRMFGEKEFFAGAVAGVTSFRSLLWEVIHPGLCGGISCWK